MAQRRTGDYRDNHHVSDTHHAMATNCDYVWGGSTSIEMDDDPGTGDRNGGYLEELVARTVSGGGSMDQCRPLCLAGVEIKYLKNKICFQNDQTQDATTQSQDAEDH